MIEQINTIKYAIIHSTNVFLIYCLQCIFSFNKFAPKLPVTTGGQIHIPSTACDVISFNGQGVKCKVKRSFKPHQKGHNSVTDTGEKGEKPCNIDLKISMKILFHCPPTFPFI